MKSKLSVAAVALFICFNSRCSHFTVTKLLFTSSWYWIKEKKTGKNRYMVFNWRGVIISIAADMTRHTFHIIRRLRFYEWSNCETESVRNGIELIIIYRYEINSYVLINDSLHIGNIGWHMILCSWVEVQFGPQNRWLDSTVLFPATRNNRAWKSNFFCNKGSSSGGCTNALWSK